MGALRKARWNKAFNDDNSENNSDTKYTIEDVVNRKATIVIEHLIQASDVAHTMQHWDVYRKWVSDTSSMPCICLRPRPRPSLNLFLALCLVLWMFVPFTE